MRTFLVGLCGTIATEAVDQVAAAQTLDRFAVWVPAVLTSLWLLRQLWLSFFPRK